VKSDSVILQQHILFDSALAASAHGHSIPLIKLYLIILEHSAGGQKHQSIFIPDKLVPSYDRRSCVDRKEPFTAPLFKHILYHPSILRVHAPQRNLAPHILKELVVLHNRTRTLHNQHPLAHYLKPNTVLHEVVPQDHYARFLVDLDSAHSVDAYIGVVLDPGVVVETYTLYAVFLVVGQFVVLDEGAVEVGLVGHCEDPAFQLLGDPVPRDLAVGALGQYSGDVLEYMIICNLL
jgi:hypothetical protein